MIGDGALDDGVGRLSGRTVLPHEAGDDEAREFNVVHDVVA